MNPPSPYALICGDASNGSWIPPHSWWGDLCKDSTYHHLILFGLLFVSCPKLACFAINTAWDYPCESISQFLASDHHKEGLEVELAFVIPSQNPIFSIAFLLFFHFFFYVILTRRNLMQLYRMKQHILRCAFYSF